jgi:hypothetical protein
MNRGQQDLLPNASTVFASRLLDTLVAISPLAQEKRGDHKLDRARELAQEFEPVISENDRDILQDRITL